MGLTQGFYNFGVGRVLLFGPRDGLVYVCVWIWFIKGPDLVCICNIAQGLKV